jgi:hypothetical protein
MANTVLFLGGTAASDIDDVVFILPLVLIFVYPTGARFES